MRALLASAVALLAGCQSTLNLDTAPASRIVAPGTGTYGGAVEVRSVSGSFVGVAIGLGVFASMVQGDASWRRSPPAEMDPNRQVREVDCTQPVDLAAGGNLRCR
jgi:hypothetical protein